MLQRGFEPAEIRKVLGENMQRVFAAATGPDTRAYDAALVAIED